MAYSYIDYTNLTSAQQAGTFAPTTLEYVELDDIYVAVTPAASGITTVLLSSQFTASTSPSLSVVITDSAVLPLDPTDTVRIGRTTEIDDLIRTFTDGSVLKASDLNAQNNQFLYAIQESLDTGATSLPIGADNKYDAGGRGIKNLGDPTNDKDAVTLEYVTALRLYDGASLPQSWYFTSGPLTNSGNDRTYTLQSPTPATAVDNMFLVEVQGVMQRPATDYTVTELNGTYTLRLFGAAAGVPNTGFPDNTPVTVRNFGASRNVLVDPFKAGSTTDDSLRIQRITNQTGLLIRATTETNQDLFRVGATGWMLLGSGSQDSNATTYLSTTEVEVGNVNSGVYTSFGVRAATALSKGIVEIMGSAPAASDVALRVYDGKSTGTVSEAVKVTYGGAMTIQGGLFAQSVATTGLLLSSGGAQIGGGDLQVAPAQHLRVGTNKAVLSETSLSGVEKAIVTPWNQSASDDKRYGFQGTNVSGCIGITTGGWPFMGAGGNGTGAAFGGTGSVFFDDGGSAERAPYIFVNKSDAVVSGYSVPAAQGGAVGEDGSRPAQLRLPLVEPLPWASLHSDGVPTKTQVESVALSGFGMWNPNWSATVQDNAYTPVEISRNMVDYDPGAEFAFRSNGGPSQTQSGIYVTGGTWLVRARGVVRCRPTTTSASVASVRTKLQVGTKTDFSSLSERTATNEDLYFTSWPSYSYVSFDHTVVLTAGDPILDIATLWVYCDASSGSTLEANVENCYISIQKVGA